MFADLNERINICKEKIILQETLKEKIRSLEILLKHKEDELSYLNKLVNKELKDVIKLKKMSIYNIILTIFRNKKNKLYKEEKEYLEAKVKYDECLFVINQYKIDMDLLSKRIKKLNSINEEYKVLLLEKYNVIKENSILGHDIHILEVKKEKLIKEKIELKEAIVEGNKCIIIIDDIIKNLENLNNSIKYDITFNDFLLLINKDSRIDTARETVNKLGYSINKFKKELKDVNMIVKDINLNIGSFNYAFDIFFNNIFDDSSFQRKIKESLIKMKNIKLKICDINRKLSYKNNDIKNNIEKIDLEIEKIIENFQDLNLINKMIRRS
ncbi:hypothetical protein [Clostridium sp. Ade.TY]|uniref:hypothetical protein n=1 Tax=Clostridium sp. Ade.TY TaxID=1391647 RepID=UPI0004144320|nr:hypothetical protein [Clostridium sp. Ade.TY]